MSKRKDRSSQRKVIRKALVLIGSVVFFFALPALPAWVLTSQISTAFNLVQPPLDRPELVRLIYLFGFIHLIGAIILSFFYEWLISFYLTVEEWQELHPDRYGNHPPGKFFRAAHQKIFQWKLQREKRYC